MNESDKTTNTAAGLISKPDVPIDTRLLLMADSMDTAVRESGVAITVQGEPQKHIQAEWCREAARKIHYLAKRLDGHLKEVHDLRTELTKVYTVANGYLKQAESAEAALKKLSAAPQSSDGPDLCSRPEKDKP